MEPDSPYPLKLTYRCQADTTRLELNLRPLEGCHGEVSVFLFPKLRVNKITIRKDFQISALSLHCLSALNLSEPLGESHVLKLKGRFSSNLMSDWLKLCLPDLPHDTTDWVFYKNTFISRQGPLLH